MPPKPTCKVVKRQGQKGARIHPKGCEVRTGVSGAGYATKTKTNKQGLKKVKIKVPGSKHEIIAARHPLSPVADWVRMTYDTGAMSSSMKPAAATKLGYPPQIVQQQGTPIQIRGVTGSTQALELDMTFYVKLGPDDWRPVSGKSWVMPNMTSSNLLGVTHIKGLKSSYNIKFV